MDIVHNPETTPDQQALAASITGEAHNRWLSLTAYIESTYKAKPQIAYSTCSGKPGWNLKYKKSGKALCTLYPEPECFTALVVLGVIDMDRFDALSEGFTDYVNSLYSSARLFNNTKWLMITVTDDKIFEDVKKLLAMKTQK